MAFVALELWISPVFVSKISALEHFDCKAQIYDLAMDINKGQYSFILWSELEYGGFYLLQNQAKIIKNLNQINFILERYIFERNEAGEQRKKFLYLVY